MRRTSLCLILIAAALAAPAQAFRLGDEPRPVRGNPADRYVKRPIEPERYDRATRCLKHPRPGVVAFTTWLGRWARGVSWGTYRCEKWGKKSASLHAENRALDWHLNAYSKSDKREARRIITMLLAPDRAGNPHALARRLGVQEIIWDCSYWGAGSEEFGRYSPCYSKRGKLRRRVNKTIAHRDHIHFGFTKAGANGRTSFWKR
jgi:hypothetical protein